MNKTQKILLISIVPLFLCCFLVGFVFYFAQNQKTLWPSTKTSTATPAESPYQTVDPDAAGAQLATAQANLNAQSQMGVPMSDLTHLTEELQGISDLPTATVDANIPYQIGTAKEFWTTNQTTNKASKIQATLQYVTPHAYFWVENGISYDREAMQKLMDTFENKIYPTDREFFGSEWTPGVDGDVHLYIVYASNLGENIAGLFSSGDEYLPVVSKYSNGHELFFLSSTEDLSSTFTYGVLAHEFQHMIHWYHDRNEDGWLNEGFSELAAFLNGYGVGGHDYVFASNPDTQLNTWATDAADRGQHYGASFLFFAYFLDRFGEKATQAVVANPLHGLDSVDDTLVKLNVTDPLTGKPVRADDIFTDWTIANFLKNGEISDGRYTYHNYPDAPLVGITHSISNCPLDWQSGVVNQYGTAYIQIACQGKFNLRFQGNIQVPVWPVDPHSGHFAFWSNKGDESDMSLTRSFDFSQTNAPIQMTYWTWYDLEKDYDFTYLLASVDGKKWDILKTPDCTTDNPSGNNLGCGYNGQSSGWIEQQVDLSSYAGKKVSLRFEYVTDPAVNGEGLLLDDIAIPAIGYQTDFEQDGGGWNGSGFVRLENTLPQTYRVTLIQRGKDTKVVSIPLDGLNTATIPLDLGNDGSDAVLVVSGTTRFTRQPASFRYQIMP
jgi:immune inhibitor A